MKRFVFITVALSVITAVFCTTQGIVQSANSDELQFGDQQPVNGVSRPVGESKKSDRQLFMRGKLAMVQKIVEGIATEDFEMIEKGGMELAALAESAAWKSTQDPYYKHYSANFEHAVKGLVAAARSESVEKATFAYVHVTISCTACHQYVRDAVRTSR
jgi:cytochrome c556